MAEMPLRTAALGLLIVECRQQAASGLTPTRDACLEIFRRALEEHDTDAWAALERQYRPVLARWLRARGIPELEIDDLAQEALTRFWMTLSRRPEALQERFPRVASLLRYLHQCAVSTHLDRLRAAQQRRRLVERVQQLEGHTPDPGQLEALLHAEVLRKVRLWMAEHVTDPTEQLLLRAFLDEGLTPAQIAQRYPAHFPEPATAHRMKERILKRARRALLGSDGGSPEESAATAAETTSRSR